MNDVEYHIMHQAEEAHWWYLVHRDLVLHELNTRVSVGGEILDAGCGTGGMLAKLKKWKSSGVDMSPIALHHCLDRGLTNVQVGTVNALPYESNSFDAVLSLDVIYHSEVDDHKAMSEMARVLRPGGVLVLNAPAFNWLDGGHDAAVCGARRYTASQVKQLVSASNLKVEMIHYWNAWLLVPLVVRRWWHRADTSDLALPPRWLNTLLAKLGKWDAWCCRWLKIPVGSSVFLVAHKP